MKLLCFALRGAIPFSFLLMPLIFSGCSQESDSIALSDRPLQHRTSLNPRRQAQAPPPGGASAGEVRIQLEDPLRQVSARVDAPAEALGEEKNSRGDPSVQPPAQPPAQPPTQQPVQPTIRPIPREPRPSEFTPYWSTPGVEKRFQTRPGRRTSPAAGRREIMRGFEDDRKIASAAPPSQRRRAASKRGRNRYRKRGARLKQSLRKQKASNRRPGPLNSLKRRKSKRQPKGFHLIKPYLTGIASWYGPKFHGRPTANGERYDQNGITAAHPVLPMGTWIRVTNRENGRVLSMRVNDRGPYARGRILDLSKGAAIRLGMYKKGTARVRIEVLRWPASVLPDVGLRPFVQYVVQVAAYPDSKLAWRELKRFRRIHGWAAFSLDRRPSGLMGIIIGPFDDKQRALNVSRRLKKSGARPLVRRYRK